MKFSTKESCILHRPTFTDSLKWEETEESKDTLWGKKQLLKCVYVDLFAYVFYFGMGLSGNYMLL